MSSSKTILSELVDRLQSQLPAAAQEKLEKMMPALNKVDPRVEALEAQIKDLEAAILGKKTEARSLEVSILPEDKPKVKVEDKTEDEAISDDIVARLKGIVDKFNTELESWYNDTRCVANFSWKYAPCKGLEVTSVDYIVYRKPAPSEKSLKEVLSNPPK